jgi:hypothetical protein
MTTRRSTIAEINRITQGSPPCTCGVFAFLGRTGLNFDIEEHARASQLRMVAGIGTIGFPR